MLYFNFISKISCEREAGRRLVTRIRFSPAKRFRFKTRDTSYRPIIQIPHVSTVSSRRVLSLANIITRINLLSESQMTARWAYSSTSNGSPRLRSIKRISRIIRWYDSVTRAPDLSVYIDIYVVFTWMASPILGWFDARVILSGNRVTACPSLPRTGQLPATWAATSIVNDE